VCGVRAAFGALRVHDPDAMTSSRLKACTATGAACVVLFAVCAAGDFGCTQALRHGHGLTVLQQHGSGKAVSLSSRRLSASAGLFVGGERLRASPLLGCMPYVRQCLQVVVPVIHRFVEMYCASMYVCRGRQDRRRPPASKNLGRTLTFPGGCKQQAATAKQQSRRSRPQQ
jgi:hypothetical protein